MSEIEITNAKKAFLDKYNPERSKPKALSLAIRAAVQHNLIYRKGLPSDERLKVRIEWSRQLDEIAMRLSKIKSNFSDYEQEVVNLKAIMNSTFQDKLAYRVSHAQKSLGVYLKHLWCMDEFPTPPQCPVDRIILTAAGAKIRDRSWGYVDDIETHRHKLSILQEAMRRDGFENLAIWELLKFSTD